MPDQSKFTFLTSSDLNYEFLVEEVYFENKFVALLQRENGFEDIRIEFPDSNVDESLAARKVNLEEFLDAIEVAKKRLLSDSAT